MDKDDVSETATTLCQLEFLNLEDGDEYQRLEAADLSLIQAILRCHVSILRPGEGGQVWTTPVPPPPEEEEEDVGLEFGCASVVFNSIAAGNFSGTQLEQTVPFPLQTPPGDEYNPAAVHEVVSGPPPLDVPPPLGLRASGYVPVVPQPGTQPHHQGGVPHQEGSRPQSAGRPSPQPGQQQHIHINSFTANLTYHASGQEFIDHISAFFLTDLHLM